MERPLPTAALGIDETRTGKPIPGFDPGRAVVEWLMTQPDLWRAGSAT